MVLKIDLFCPKQFKIGQQHILEETPDIKSKFSLTVLIIPLQLILFTLKHYKDIVTYKGLDFYDFKKRLK